MTAPSATPASDEAVGDATFTESHGAALREFAERIYGNESAIITKAEWESICAFVREGEEVMDARGERIRELEAALSARTAAPAEQGLSHFDICAACDAYDKAATTDEPAEYPAMHAALSALRARLAGAKVQSENKGDS